MTDLAKIRAQIAYLADEAIRAHNARDGERAAAFAAEGDALRREYDALLDERRHHATRYARRPQHERPGR